MLEAKTKQKFYLYILKYKYYMIAKITFLGKIATLLKTKPVRNVT
jgi:hypothetical protein